MSHFEERLVRRWAGIRILAASLVIGLCGIAPLALYILFGPADGNPIGLGLLAMVTVPFAGAGMLLGLVKMAVEFCLGQRG